MALSSPPQILLSFSLLLFFLSVSTFATTTATINTTTPPLSPFTLLTPILTALGFHSLATASHSLSLSLSLSFPFLQPTTLFAPSDSSLSSCYSCSPSLLLQEHTLPGLFPLHYLQSLAFGTKIRTILPQRCLTLTYSSNSSVIFINGAELVQPDLFNNGHVIIHGIKGFLSHLSPYSCFIDRMTSLSLPPPSPEKALTKMMISDVVFRLRTGGFSILALAMRMRFRSLADVVENMTVFALDDDAIFRGGSAYIRDLRFHVVPNRIMYYDDLDNLPVMTSLPTLADGGTLLVTSAGGGGGGELSPMRINYVKIRSPDLMYNMKVVVHGLSEPFPHLSWRTASSPSIDEVPDGRRGFDDGGDHDREEGSQNVSSAPTPEIDSVSMDEVFDYHHRGL